jgi:hypothetical protein
MVKIIITENQLKYITRGLANHEDVITEAVGVPKNIIESGRDIYDIISKYLKSIKTKKNQYQLVLPIDITIDDLTFDSITVIINVEDPETLDADINMEDPVIASMAVSNKFQFDDNILMQLNQKNQNIELYINFVAPKVDWNPIEIYNSFTKNKSWTQSLLTHELKHKFDRQKKRLGLVGDTADYQTYSSQRLKFGIPVIDKFMRYSYFIQTAENLVRPTEIAARMIENGITREEFYDFITNDEVYKELKDINNFTYNHLIKSLYNQIEYIDSLIEYAGEMDPKKMTDKEKVKYTLQLVYINLINSKLENFDNYFYSAKEKFDQMFLSLFPNMSNNMVNKQKENVRNKFINFLGKYEGRELDFFKDECERFNYETRKIMKKISKIYALIPDKKEETNESIINWDLNQKIMEKRYGKRPLDTTYKIKK